MSRPFCEMCTASSAGRVWLASWGSWAYSSPLRIIGLVAPRRVSLMTLEARFRGLLGEHEDHEHSRLRRAPGSDQLSARRKCLAATVMSRARSALFPGIPVRPPSSVSLTERDPPLRAAGLSSG